MQPSDSRKNTYDRDDLVRCGSSGLFGLKAAKLPSGQMLMFDRILEISDAGGAYGKGIIRAELDIQPDLWFFGCHFVDDPVMPGCLGLDALWQCADSSCPGPGASARDGLWAPAK